MLMGTKGISSSENFWKERSHLGVSMVIEGTLLRVCVVKFPLDWVSIGHERRSGDNAMKLGIPNFGICRLVMGYCKEIIIVEY